MRSTAWCGGFTGAWLAWGLVDAPAGDEPVDPLGAESLALAGLAQAAVRGRAALGGRAGRGPQRVGADPDAPWVDRDIPLHAHEGGSTSMRRSTSRPGTALASHSSAAISVGRRSASTGCSGSGTGG